MGSDVQVNLWELSLEVITIPQWEILHGGRIFTEKATFTVKMVLDMIFQPDNRLLND